MIIFKQVSTGEKWFYLAYVVDNLKDTFLAIEARVKSQNDVNSIFIPKALKLGDEALSKLAHRSLVSWLDMRKTEVLKLKNDQLPLRPPVKINSSWVFKLHRGLSLKIFLNCLIKPLFFYRHLWLSLLKRQLVSSGGIIVKKGLVLSFFSIALEVPVLDAKTRLLGLKTRIILVVWLIFYWDPDIIFRRRKLLRSIVYMVNLSNLLMDFLEGFGHLALKLTFLFSGLLLGLGF
jgi:hypothetical protein